MRADVAFRSAIIIRTCCSPVNLGDDSGGGLQPLFIRKESCFRKETERAWFEKNSVKFCTDSQKTLALARKIEYDGLDIVIQARRTEIFFTVMM
jgi:hypothetical protein